MNPSNTPDSDPLTEAFGPTIFAYTRAQALADGVLVPVPELDAALAGFTPSFAVNASVWSAANAGDPANRATMLAQCRAAVGGMADKSDDRVYFALCLPPGGEQTLDVVLHCGPGDAGEPVLTLCEPQDL